MSSQLQNVQITLKDLSKNIDNGLYSIPKFQRNFVWKKRDIESLGDSLVRGYPISSMLTMSMNGSLEVGYEALKTGNYVIAKEIKTDGIYILDGQQRITSIAKIFNNLDENNTYYFDLLAILKERFPDDNIDSLIKKENYGKVMKSKITDVFCRALPNGKSDFQPTRYTRFISGRTIADDKYGSAINKFLRNLNDEDEDKIDKYNDYLSALFGELTNYSIQVTEINQDADLGLICRVFEKVNSTGVKLTTFDLINAKSFSSSKIKDAKGLSNYITEAIQNEYYKNDLSSNNSFIGTFLCYSQEGELFKDLSKIIRALFLSDSLDNDKIAYLTQSELLAKDADFWVDAWDNKKEIFFKFMDLLEKENLVNVLPTSYLEYVLSIVLSIPKVMEHPAFIKMIKKNGLALSIMSATITKSEIELYKQMVEFAKNLIHKNIDSHENCMFVKFDLPNIEDILPGQRAFRSIFYIMTSEHHLGKFTKDITNNTINTNKNNIDLHHIIPKARTKEKNQQKRTIFKSLANFVPLNSYTNREEIKDILPSIYMKELESKIPEFNHIKEQNLIPKQISDDEQFLIQRKELLTSYINSYFK